MVFLRRRFYISQEFPEADRGTRLSRTMPAIFIIKSCNIWGLVKLGKKTTGNFFEQEPALTKAQSEIL
jgi:hypothetical protein